LRWYCLSLKSLGPHGILPSKSQGIELNPRTGVTAFLLVVGLVLAILAGVAYLQPQMAMAELSNASGQAVGSATFFQQPDGVRVFVRVNGLSPGDHGAHIHAVGRCDGPDFKTSGGHLNPEGKKHGLVNPEGPHAGDSPNLEIGPDGTGVLEYINPRVTLSSRTANSLSEVSGTSLVIHANADDQKTDPSGNSGTRIACGVIAAAEPAFGPLPAWLLTTLAVVLLASGLGLCATTRRRGPRDNASQMTPSTQLLT